MRQVQQDIYTLEVLEPHYFVTCGRKTFQWWFYFRLEDTDIKRNVVGGEASQLDNLAWLGIIPDESPLNPNPKYKKYRQSEKLDRYREMVNLLIEKGLHIRRMTMLKNWKHNTANQKLREFHHLNMTKTG